MWIYMNANDKVNEQIFDYNNVISIYACSEDTIAFNISAISFCSARRPKNLSIREIFEYLNAVNEDSPADYILEWDSIEWGEDGCQDIDYIKKKYNGAMDMVDNLTFLLEQFLENLKESESCKEI